MFAAVFSHVLSKGLCRVWERHGLREFEVLTYLAMKRSVLFLAAVVLLGVGLQSCDREENNGDNNGGGSGGDNSSLVWVDLGLPSGLLWADRNVGASSPEDYGNYYAWGETTPKDVYDWRTYAHGHSYNTLTKYCYDAFYGLNGFSDNLTTLQVSDDAATANLGGGARTPTRYEWEELLDNTTDICTTRNGVIGILLTASNGKSLFLPAAGFCYGSSLSFAGRGGDYWSGTLDVDNPYCAWRFSFGHPEVQVDYREYGFSVRAVCASQN